MSYSGRIRMLEESYRLVEAQISNTTDTDKLAQLNDTKTKYLNQLRELRRLEYEERQIVDFSDDR
jgi:hypothetical protein